MRSHLSLFAFLAIGTLFGANSKTQAEEKESENSRPPNIVFFMTDDLGYAELGCYGQTKIRTPRIDQLAEEGMRFTQFYSSAPVCAPARCQLMTGLHSGHAFIRTNKETRPDGQYPIPDETITIGELLQDRGYITAAIGKWGLGEPESEGGPNKQGFDHFFGYSCQREAHNFYPRYLWRNDERIPLEGNDRGLTGKQYSHDLCVEEALEFVRNHQDEPFFLYVPYSIPHLAIQVPEDSLEEYLGKWEDPPYEGGHGYLPHPAPRAGYAAMVTRMDRDTGRIVDLIDELGLGDNTIIFFTSDNGPTYNRLGGSDSDFFESAGPFRGLKGSVYEGGIRVPLIARWPGHIQPETTSDLQAAFWDVLPTLATIGGAETPEGLDGISMTPTLFDEGEQTEHEFLYWEFPSYGGQQAVRMGDWKGVRQQLFKGEVTTELYNLAEDIGEENNVAEAHPDIVEKIEAIFEEQHTNSELFPIPAIDKEE